MLKDFIEPHIVEKDLHRRLRSLPNWSSVFVAGECPFGGSQSAKAATAEGLCIAQVVTFCWTQGIIFEQVTPDEVKRIATGRRQAVSKSNVQVGLSAKFGNSNVFKDHDAGGENLLLYLNNNHKKTDFEDIADSIAAATHVVENSNMYKAFLS